MSEYWLWLSERPGLTIREKLALLEQRISELEARNNSVADLQSPPAIPPIDKAE